MVVYPLVCYTDTVLSELKKLGLSEKEAKVYLAALELGGRTAQEIAKKAGVNRATTYVLLLAMIKKGLASSFTKGKKTLFTAEPPEQLDHLLRKQEEQIFEQRRDLEKMIPELRALYNRAEAKPKIRFFEGYDGIRAMIDEVTRTAPKGAKLSEFLALDEALAAFPNYAALTSFHLFKRRLQARVIYTHADGPQKGMDDVAEQRAARYVPRDRYPFAASILVIPEIDRVVISTYRRGYAGIILENAELAQTLQIIFDFWWRKVSRLSAE